MKRRSALAAVAAYLAQAHSSAQPKAQDSAQTVAALLKTGGCVLMLRHAQTEAGIGDPPGFALGQCSTQRNLNDEGRAQSRRIGAWFRSQGLQPRAVQSSAWCRCVDTATLAFGGPQLQVKLPLQLQPALNSTFGTPDQQPAQTRALKALLPSVPAGQFEVWVTHQVNMTDLCGAYPGLGEGFVVSAQGALLARHVFA